jgi:hypothetical protein
VEQLRLAGSSVADRIRAIVVIEVREARPIISPVYDDRSTSEAEVTRAHQARYDRLYPPPG